MKTRFMLTPIAAATMALGSSFALATTHDTKPPITETRSSPQTTNQQQQQGTADKRVTGQQTTPTPGVPGAPRVPGTPGASGTVAPGKDTVGATGTAGRTATQASTRSVKQHRASQIIGMDVVNRQGEKIGDVEDIVVDSRGNISHVVVSTGTFLAIGERLHAIPWNSVNRDTAGENFVVDVDRDRLRNAPGFDRNNWPNMTDQQWNQQNQRYFPRSASAPQTGKRAYGTDVDKDRMRADRPATTGTQAAGDASASRAGKSPYGTDVSKERMRTDQPATTGTQPGGQASESGAGKPAYGTDVSKERMRTDQPATTGTQPAGQASESGAGKPPYGTDVSKERMDQGKTGTTGTK